MYTFIILDRDVDNANAQFDNYKFANIDELSNNKWIHK